MKYLIPLLLSLSPIVVFSHGDEDHSKPTKKEVTKSKNDDHGGHKHGHEKSKVQFDKAVLSSVNKNYIKTVRPIFVNKCFDCHSSSKPLPWYSKVPLAGDIVKGDRKEGLTHLDITNDFPFGGHGGPVDDIKAIQKSIEKDSMPPLLYKAFHWRSGLTDEEKEQINQWVENSLQLLKTPKGGR